MPYEQIMAKQQTANLRTIVKNLPDELRAVLADQISICLNLKSSPRTRATAAFRAARSINTVDARQAGCTIEDSMPWYVLATQLGHIRASHEYALALIARNGFRVHRPTYTVVPFLAESVDPTLAKTRTAVDQRVINAWTIGLSTIHLARATLFHGWDVKHFRSAIYILTDWSFLGTQPSAYSSTRIPPTAINEWHALSSAWPYLVAGATQDSMDDAGPLSDYTRLRSEIQCALMRHAAAVEATP